MAVTASSALSSHTLSFDPLPDIERNPWFDASATTGYSSGDDEGLHPLLPTHGPPQARRWTSNYNWVEQLLSYLGGPRLPNCRPQLTFLKRPWVPSDPSALTFAILLIVMFVLVVAASIKKILDPDKYQLPWRSYCTLSPTFPPPSPDLSSLVPVGLFIGVMSTASSYQRRQLIRSTWASHPSSRGGVDGKSEMYGTSQTVVRFIVGTGQESEEGKLKLENELYGDIVVLPIKENMNNGKTHAYFSWAHEHALVPPWLNSSASLHTQFPRHDPVALTSDWTRPDFVIKADDDSFVMLSELEARLRVEWDSARTEDQGDPLLYWGYLVKERFMAGEMYALSSSLVEYVATSELVKGLTAGAEDQQVAKWIKAHPHASKVRWRSERCWIYNHPKSANVYAHGFLFPSEAERVKGSIGEGQADEEIRRMGLPTSFKVNSPRHSWSSVTGPAPRYMLPTERHNLTVAMEIETLVEGSALSWEVSPRRPQDRGFQSNATSPWGRIQDAFDRRETRAEQYRGKNLGGTVVVHYLKKDEWFIETRIALLGS